MFIRENTQLRQSERRINLGLRSLAWLALIAGMASCASVSVDKHTDTATPQMPQKIYVTLFDTARGEFNVDREGAELVEFKRDLQIMMQVALVTDLSHRLVFATPAIEGSGFSRENAWVIRGEFTRVNQGSRFLRAAIGMGAGGTKVETNVSVYNLSQNSKIPFLTFSTTGGSGAEPGAITGIATDPVVLAVQVALSGIGGLAHGLTEDTKRTDREITAQLSDYMYRSGWIGEDKWIEPKKLDKD
jgi:Domain of unknown function (DUF4410)